MPILTVGKPLREKLGDEAVDSLVDLINQSQENQKNDILEFVEEKFERRLSEEIGGLENRLTLRISAMDNRISEMDNSLSARIANVDNRLSAKIAAVDNRLSTKISETKADLIKWMFIFWVGQVGVILGILFAFFKR
ncbi:MAG: LA_3696 family protein [bacterium]